MPMDVHEEARALIASCLAADATPAERQRLAEHLAACPGCRREMELSRRSVRALGEIAFAAVPELDGRVRTALARRSRELAEESARRRKRLLGFAAAVAMTAAGSLAVWKGAAEMPMARDLAPAGLAAIVAIFWALPSFAAAILLLAPSALASPYGKELG
jgi:anti-sigma factor RsiW